MIMTIDQIIAAASELPSEQRHEIAARLLEMDQPPITEKDRQLARITREAIDHATANGEKPRDAREVVAELRQRYCE